MRFTWVAAVVCGLALLGTAQQSRNQEASLQKAIQTEMVDGDLKSAIEMYRKLAQGRDRAIAAQALVRMGQCYEKLGDAEARKAYERVVKEFADQREAAAQARVRIASLTTASQRDVPVQIAVRRIGKGEWLDVGGEPSPDGQWLSCVDWETGGNLAIRDLRTGQLRRLTNNGKESEEPVSSRWSPDGQRLAYDWFRNELESDLRVVGRDGSNAKILYTPPQGWWVEVADWSEDGRQILVLEGRGRHETKIVSVAVADGAARTVREMPRDSAYSPGMRFSRDGRFVVYDYLQGVNTSNRDVFVTPVGGGSETRLVEHPGDDFSLGWTPDGGWVLFGSDRSGSMDIWAVPVKEGKASGPARLVKSGVEGIAPLGFTRDGTFFYGFERWRQRDVYMAELNPKTGEALGEPRKAVRLFEGHNHTPEFSPDGKLLAYVSNRGHQQMNRYSELVLCVDNLETGAHREYGTGRAFVGQPRWLPDASAVLAGFRDAAGGGGFFRIHLATGSATPLVAVVPGERMSSLAVASDGKGIFYVVRGDATKSEHASRIVYRSLETGEERELFRGAPGDVSTLALSPDGKRLAFLNLPPGPDEHMRIVRVMPASGGEPKQVGQFKHYTYHTIPLVWSADGEYLLVPRLNQLGPQGDGRWSLWRVPASGGEAKKIGLDMFRLDSLSLDREGRRLAFTSVGTEVPEEELWVMEGFLPRL